MGYAQVQDITTSPFAMTQPDNSVDAIIQDIPGMADKLYGDPAKDYSATVAGVDAIRPQGGKQLAGAGLVALLSLLAGKGSGYAGVAAPGQAWNQSFETADAERMKSERAALGAKAAPFLAAMNSKNTLIGEAGGEAVKGMVKSRLPLGPEHRTPEMKNAEAAGVPFGAPFKEFLTNSKNADKLPSTDQFKAGLLQKRASNTITELESDVLDSMEKPTADKALSPGQYLVQAVQKRIAAGKMTEEQGMSEIARIAGQDPELLKSLIGDRLGDYTPPFADKKKTPDVIKYDNKGNRVQ